MPEGLLVLPLLGGFLFLHICHDYRFKAQRWDGYRLLLASAVAGVILLLLGRLVVLAFSKAPILNSWAESVWFSVVPFPYSDTCAWSLCLGPLLAFAVNRKLNTEEAKDRQISRTADAFLRLLHIAARESRPISVTFDTRKWYVGHVTEVPSLNPDEKYFRLLPLFSGYRDKDTLDAVRTVFYEDVLELGDPRDLVITLPVAGIKSANFFDPEIYDYYFAGKSQA